MNKGQQVVTCKKCGGNKLTRIPMGLVMLFVTSIMFWIPIIGWIMFIPSLLLTILFMIPTGKVMMQCADCKHGNTVSKATYNEFKKALQ